MSEDQSLPTRTALLQGDAGAWENLFDAHYAPTARYVAQLGVGFAKEDVEEICQETFLSVVRNIATFKGGSQLQTWIFRIAANKARDFLSHRQTAKRGHGIQPLSLDEEPAEGHRKLDPPSSRLAPDAELLSTEQAKIVRDSLDAMGDPCREILELRYFGDLSYEEIAVSLDLNPKTVSSRLSKCLDRLGKILSPVFGENPV